MTTGPIPDDVPSNLQEQILLEDAKAIPGLEIQGGPDMPLGDAPRLVTHYGGNPEDWYKIVSTQSTIIDGIVVEVHWFRNTRTLQNVEFKFKRIFPKTARKNQ